MKRFHIHVSVDDLAANVRFYSTMFGVPPTYTETRLRQVDGRRPSCKFRDIKTGCCEWHRSPWSAGRFGHRVVDAP